MAHRTQVGRSAETRAALIAAGLRQFGRHGYAATSVEAVAAEAGATKGAAYHHFDGKAALFKAVFTHQEQDLAAALSRAAASAPNTWLALHTGCRAFLKCCLDQGIRQIVLLDGPAVLGWDTVREIEHQHTLRMLRRGMDAAAADGHIAAQNLDIRSQLLFGALCEAGMLLARAADPDAALHELITEADHLLDSLAQPTQQATGAAAGTRTATERG